MEYRTAGEKDLALLAELNQQLIHDEGHFSPMSVSELEDRMRAWLVRVHGGAVRERGDSCWICALPKR